MKKVLFLLISVICVSALATWQVKDLLEYNGQQYQLGLEDPKFPLRPTDVFPFEFYLEKKNMRLDAMKYGHNVWTTGCNRGYIAQWKIDNDQLLLVKLTLYPPIPDRTPPDIEYPLPDINRSWKSPVLAEWYSGTFQLFPPGFRNDWIPLYQVEVKNGKIINMAKCLLHDIITSEQAVDERRERYKRENKQLYQQHLIKLSRSNLLLLKPGMSTEEAKEKSFSGFFPINFEEELELVPPDTVKQTIDNTFFVLRHYLYKEKKDSISEGDLSLDLIFQYDKFPDRSSKTLKAATVNLEKIKN